MNCPRCGRHNPEDALFCLRCGQRLGGRSSGVSYRQRSSGGGFGLGQTMLALLVVLLAGLVLAGGAFLVLFAGRPPLTPTAAGGVPTSSPSELPTFVQESPSPSASPLLTPSPVLPPSASPSGSFLLPTASPTPSAPLPTDPPPTARPTPRPTRAPQPTPEPTPFACTASGGNETERVIGFGNPTERGPRADRGWCLDRAVFRVINGSTFGVIRLFRNNREIASVDCTSVCAEPVSRTFDPPVRVREGQVLRYVFTCVGNPNDPGQVDECNDANPDGGTIQLFYRVFPAP